MGIKGVPVLSHLSSIRFPESFPGDFMHIVWENAVKGLVDIWSGEYKGLDLANEPFVLTAKVRKQIGADCIASGSSIPASYGCRVPDPWEQRLWYTSEAWGQFTMLVAPVVLRGRFREERYYSHFMDLVRLINLCISRSLSSDDIEELRTGFAKWVVDFERMYIKNDRSRIVMATLPIHYLLHIADSIKMSGPVWCYWAFPMERFCGSLLPAINSRKHPYRCIDRRITELAQVNQIKHIYNLYDELNLDRKQLGQGDSVIGYPELELHNPRKELTLTPHQRRKLVDTLWDMTTPIDGDLDDTLLDYIKAQVPRTVTCWGKMRQEGCMIHAAELNQKDDDDETGRDMTYIKYKLRSCRRLATTASNPYTGLPPNIRSQFTTAFGQLQLIFHVEIPKSEEHGLGTDISRLIFMVSTAKVHEVHKGVGYQVVTKGDFHPDEFIDADRLVTLAARVVRRQHTSDATFVTRPGSYSYLGLEYDDV